MESQTRRHPQRYETEPSRNTPNIINQAHMGGTTRACNTTLIIAYDTPSRLWAGFAPRGVVWSRLWHAEC